MDFESIKNKVTEIAQTGVTKAKELTQEGVAKTKELAEIGKLKANSAAEREAIRKAYVELGKLYFAERGTEPEPAYAALCAKVIESKERIAYNEERIADIKRSGDLTDEDVASAGDGEE